MMLVTTSPRHACVVKLPNQRTCSYKMKSPVYRAVWAMPPPTPTTTANLLTRPSKVATALAICCCGVPMTSGWR